MCGTGKDGYGTYKMLKSAFGEETVSCTRTFEWSTWLQESNISKIIHHDHTQLFPKQMFEFVTKAAVTNV